MPSQGVQPPGGPATAGCGGDSRVKHVSTRQAQPPGKAQTATQPKGRKPAAASKGSGPTKCQPLPTQKILENMKTLESRMRQDISIFPNTSRDGLASQQTLVEGYIHALEDLMKDLERSIQHSQLSNGNQLNQLLSKVSDIHQTVVPQQKNPSKSWAAVAAQMPHNPPGLSPHIPQKKPDEEITIRPLETNEALRDATNAKDILTILAQPLARAGPVAARRLRSGDIRVTVQNKPYIITNKGSIQHQLGVTILREDFPLEVMAVPKSLTVQEGKGADNTGLLQGLEKSNQKRIPGIQLTKAHWIQKPKAKNTQERARSSLILGVSTPAAQWEAIRQGIIIDGQIYQARLYDYNVHLTRCFNCSRWGHPQSRCPATGPTCGHCGRPHQTMECQEQQQSYCTNCKSRDHKAWQVRDCPAYQTLREKKAALRLQLQFQSDHIRNTGPSFVTPLKEFCSPQAGEKRKPHQGTQLADKRRPSPSSGPNPVGRPRFNNPSQALRSQTQSTLSSWSTPTDSDGDIPVPDSQSTPEPTPTSMEGVSTQPLDE